MIPIGDPERRRPVAGEMQAFAVALMTSSYIPRILLQMSARVSAKCGLSEQEHARRASAFSMAALLLMRTWSMVVLVREKGLGRELRTRSRLCVHSFRGALSAEDVEFLADGGVFCGAC